MSLGAVVWRIFKICAGIYLFLVVCALLNNI